MSTGRVSLCRLHVSFQGMNKINAQRPMPPYFTLTSGNTSIFAPRRQSAYYYGPTKGWIEIEPKPHRTRQGQEFTSLTRFVGYIYFR